MPLLNLQIFVSISSSYKGEEGREGEMKVPSNRRGRRGKLTGQRAMEERDEDMLRYWRR